MKAALDQIAKRCGVSKTTVSRVLNQRPYVKEEVQRKVLAAIKDMNYSPRQLALRRTVVLAVGGIGSRMGLYEAAVVSGLTGHLMKLGLAVRIHPAEDFDLERAFDLNCVVATCHAPELLARLKLPKGLPGILVNNVAEGFHSVCSDHAQGLSLGVELLAASGHRRIGLLLGSCQGWGNVERLRGYREALGASGLSQDSALLQTLERPMAEALARMLLAKPDAVIVSGEDAAIEANYALRILGRSVPDDLSLVTFEHAAVSSHMLPPNSTVDQRLDLLCSNAAELAFKLLEGELPAEPAAKLFHSCEFIERESTKARG